MEDQYLVCDQPMGRLRPMLDILKDKLGQDGFQRLVIFTTRIDEINADFQQTGWKHRRNMLKTLLDAAKRPGQVIICQYKSNRQLKRPVTPESIPPGDLVEGSNDAGVSRRRPPGKLRPALLSSSVAESLPGWTKTDHSPSLRLRSLETSAFGFEGEVSPPVDWTDDPDLRR